MSWYTRPPILPPSALSVAPSATAAVAQVIPQVTATPQPTPRAVPLHSTPQQAALPEPDDAEYTLVHPTASKPLLGKPIHEMKHYYRERDGDAGMRHGGDRFHDRHNARVHDYISRGHVARATRYDRSRSHTMTMTKKKEKEAADHQATGLPNMYTSPVNMHDNSYCRVTRSYESAFTSGTSQPGIAAANQNTFLPFYPGNWNNAIGTDGVFAPATLGNSDGVAFSLVFEKSSITGVTANTGPRMVRGGPTSTSWVTDPMTQGGGWTQWNNDFFQFLNIFRYSRLDKLEMLIKLPNITRGADPGSNSSSWSNLNGDLDPGWLGVAAWGGQPGVVTDYATGNGALINSFQNGNLTPQAWEEDPLARKVPLFDDRNQNPFRIITVPIKPVQPIVVQQSDATGQPITGSDENLEYRYMPTVDSYAFVNQEQNHNAFGFKMFHYHPDLAGIVTSTTNMPPWVSIGFRATMTWWGLTNPDAGGGAAISSPLADLCLLPGAEDCLRKYVQHMVSQRDKDLTQLAQAVGQLRECVSRRPLMLK